MGQRGFINCWNDLCLSWPVRNLSSCLAHNPFSFTGSCLLCKKFWKVIPLAIKPSLVWILSQDLSGRKRDSQKGENYIYLFYLVDHRILSSFYCPSFSS